MREDRLRALRAIRFAARLDFAIDDETWKAIVRSAPHLPRLSRERVKQEIEKTMEQVRCPSRAFALWRSSGALASLVPPLASASRRSRSRRRITSRCRAATRRPERVDARRAPSHSLVVSRTRPGARPHGAARSSVLERRQCGRWPKLAEHWATLFDPCRQRSPSRDRARRRDDPAMGRDDRTERSSPPFCDSPKRDGPRCRAAGVPAPTRERASSVYRRALRIAYRDPIELADLAVDGEDLQREGIARGPALGKILRALLEWVVEDPSRNTRDQLLRSSSEPRARDASADGRREELGRACSFEDDNQRARCGGAFAPAPMASRSFARTTTTRRTWPRTRSVSSISFTR